MELPENQRQFPDFVIAAFNDCIKQTWNGREAKILQDEAVRAIMKAGRLNRDQVFSKKYLDIEPLYQSQGWIVEYDKPAYNESYEAFYVFRRKA